jgi:hypothetical protein
MDEMNNPQKSISGETPLSNISFVKYHIPIFATWTIIFLSQKSLARKSDSVPFKSKLIFK